MTTTWSRTVEATDAVIAQGSAVAQATTLGHRVRTVRSVRVVPGTELDERPRWTVVLAVEPRALVPEGSECG